MKVVKRGRIAGVFCHDVRHNLGLFLGKVVKRVKVLKWSGVQLRE